MQNIDKSSLWDSSGSNSPIGKISADEIEFAFDTAGLLSDVQVVDDLQMFPAFFEVGAGQIGIVGASIDEEAELLTLFNFVAAEAGTRLSATQVRTVVDQSVRLYRQASRISEFMELSSELREFATQISSLQDQISLVRVVLVTRGIAPAKNLEDYFLDGTKIKIELFDSVRLKRATGLSVSREDIDIDFEKVIGSPLRCLAVPALENSDFDTYLAAIPGNALCSIYSEYSTRLLELNVRAFLGVRGKKTANAGLRETLIKEPSHFLAYNNGIVATADALQLTADGLSIKAIKGLQIVNGGQTTASLHRARVKDGANLDHVLVPAKIIHVRAGGEMLDQMVARISRSANTQNTVQPADFSANDPFHREVENRASNTWSPDGRARWFYERARGTYGVAEDMADSKADTRTSFKSETPKERRFDKTQLARYLNTWEGRPFEVAAGAQKNFQYFMQRMKQVPFQIDEAWYQRLIALALLYRTTERIVREEAFPAYRAVITVYTVAALGQLTAGRIDFARIWRDQAISPEFQTLIRSWSHHLDRLIRLSAGSRMPTEWAKKEECWNLIRQSIPQVDAPLPPEIAGIATGTIASRGATDPSSAALSPGDLELVRRVMQLSANKILKIGEKGRQTGLLHWKVAAICQTVASYAAGSWQRRPSVKQCRIVIDAMDKLMSAGEPIDD
jgi:hypothetical protein